MHKTHHLTFAEAINDTLYLNTGLLFIFNLANSILDKVSLRVFNEQLLFYTEGIFGDIPEIKSPLDLRPSHILPIAPHDSSALIYPALAGVGSHILRLHFLILQVLLPNLSQDFIYSIRNSIHFFHHFSH